MQIKNTKIQKKLFFPAQTFKISNPPFPPKKWSDATIEELTAVAVSVLIVVVIILKKYDVL